MSAAHDRVRLRTAPEVLQRIDDATTSALARCAVAGPAAATQRLQALDREWDTDRVLEVETAVTGLAGVSLAAVVARGFGVLPALAAAALLLHATTGRHPWLPLLRRLGVRSAREIERERYALKALRGDFAGLGAAAAPGTSDEEAGTGSAPRSGTRTSRVRGVRGAGAADAVAGVAP